MHVWTGLAVASSGVPSHVSSHFEHAAQHSGECRWLHFTTLFSRAKCACLAKNLPDSATVAGSFSPQTRHPASSLALRTPQGSLHPNVTSLKTRTVGNWAAQPLRSQSIPGHFALKLAADFQSCDWLHAIGKFPAAAPIDARIL